MWYENLFGAFWILLQFIFWIAVILIALSILGVLAISLWGMVVKAVTGKRDNEHSDR